MTRWQPNAGERLREAALELYGERGYDQTTVAEIAQRAGLTERTFFRHFADKREVLFAGSEVLQERFVAAIDGAPPNATALDAIAVALDAVAEIFDEAMRPFATRRQAIIAANAELQERELIKLASLAAAAADALRRRGVDEPAASLAAESAVAVFKIGFERWVQHPDADGLAELLRDSLDELRGVTAARP